MVNRVKTSLIILFTLSLLIGCQPPTPTALLIEPPTIDGVLSPGEWDAAWEESFVDGSQLFLLASGKSLYLGIRSIYSNKIMGNVFIQREDEISVLHISAALGTAIYQREAETWQLTRGFTWQCRDTSDSPAATAERQAFLNQDGWLGSISGMAGTNELEYQIRLSDEPLRMVVVFENFDYMGLQYIWPTSIDSFSGELPHGDPPSEMIFTPEDWAEISLTRGGELQVDIP